VEIRYSDTQIYSFAILLIFGTIALFKVWRFFTLSDTKRHLKRYRSLKRLKKLTWDGFEKVCLVLFEEKGWKVKGNEIKGPDGGVDLWMKKRHTTAIVQCKKYEDAKVTVKVIREMYGLMHEYGVDQAYVVTTSDFTKECYRFAAEKEMILINGEKLVSMIRRVVR